MTLYVLARGGGILIWRVRWDCACTCQRGWDFDMTCKIKIPPPLASTYKVTFYGSYKNPTPLASTCTVSSYTSYQNPTPSGKYMHSLILHVISKSHPLWQVHAQSHLTRHIKIPPPLASTCTVSSYTSCTCQRGWDFDMTCKMRLCMYLPEGVGFWYDV